MEGLGEDADTRSLSTLTQAILDVANPSYMLRPELFRITEILGTAATRRFDRGSDIATGETVTPNGLAVSPRLAALCAEDIARTVQFLRGVHDAIRDAQSDAPGRPVRVLYAGCGPFATLAIPLMSVLAARDVAFTMIDVHPESIESVEAILEALGLTEYASACLTMDAADYRIDADAPPDVIVTEVMQAILFREPQVAITRHLVSQAPGSRLVPCDIEIDLRLVDVGKEFAFAGEGDSTPARDRINLGVAFALNNATVDSWAEVTGERLPGETLSVPTEIEPRYQPMLFTKITTFGDHVLSDYDSGLTTPRTLTFAEPLIGGRPVTFHYELGSDPRLVAEQQP